MQTSDTTNSITKRGFCRVSLVAVMTFIFACSGYLAYSHYTTNNTSDGYMKMHETFVKKQKLGHSKTECNCLSVNTSNSARCCQRIIFRAHKWGTILVRDLFQDFRHAYSKFRIAQKAISSYDTFQLANPERNDYRHVLVTRNWFDAIVSGYLYHKAGHECWIDYQGDDREMMNRTDDWDLQLTFADNTYTVPPRNNRSLCLYLQQETQEDGLKVIMDLALSKWYKGVVPYYNKVQSKFRVNRSLFLCYEDLVNPFLQEQIFHDVLAFMFPERCTSEIEMPTHLLTFLKQQQLNNSIYSGKHASSHDFELRTRLMRLVEQYDRKLFDDAVASSHALFGCGKGNHVV